MAASPKTVNKDDARRRIPGSPLSGYARESPLAPRPREPVRRFPPLRGSPLHDGDLRGEFPRRHERTSGKGRAALVTGAGRGIGRAIVLALVREGFDVVGVDIVFEPDNVKTGLFEVKERVRELGGRFLPVAGDVGRLEDHDRVLDAAAGVCGRLDLLVNNAGIAPLVRRGILETEPASYDRLLSINARGPFFLTQNAARRMMAQKPRRDGVPSSIVFITSVSAAVSSTSRPEYCVSKAALSMTSTLFADALAAKGIGVYEVRPGIIATDMTAGVKAKYDRLIGAGLVPQGRWGRPEDVGRAVAALARGDFAFSTGAIVEVSGGLDIRRL